MHTHELLTIASAIVPDRTAVVFEDQRYTFADLAARANRLANALASAGVVAGDRIAVMDVNTPQHFELYFATARLDAIYVPLNFRGRDEEIGFPLEHASPKVIVAGDRYAPLIDDLRHRAPDGASYVVLTGEALPGWTAYDDFLASGEDDEVRFPGGDPDDTAVLLFTAGTTGRPKAVMLTHSSFTSYVLTSVEPP
ncbi:MAG: AMP-binding protein, partial [Dehalococcoidia bacterium]